MFPSAPPQETKLTVSQGTSSKCLLYIHVHVHVVITCTYPLRPYAVTSSAYTSSVSIILAALMYSRILLKEENCIILKYAKMCIK